MKQRGPRAADLIGTLAEEAKCTRMLIFLKESVGRENDLFSV